MPHVITRPCCNDASCVAVCPVNCIHPTPDEPDFATAEMLHIDPAACIDCGACVDECPVDAIVPDDLLPESSIFPDMNSDYYRGRQISRRWTPPRPSTAVAGPTPLRVAIVGAGPAGFYTAEELLRHRGVRVDMFDRLPTPYGLVRAGVAPDHWQTKGVERSFEAIAARDGFRYFLNVEAGKHITLQCLRERYGAVVFASGAVLDRRLGIAGEHLPGSVAVTDFVAWYNGHPDHAGEPVDLSGDTAVIVGNGNVALDAARILLTDPEQLARSDIADYALDALRASRIRTVVIVGRRGIAHAAYTNSEFEAFGDLAGIDVVIDPADIALDPATSRAEQAGTLDPVVKTKVRLARNYAARASTGASRTVVFRYLASPIDICSSAPDVNGEKVAGVHFVRNAYSPDNSSRVIATGARFAISTQMVIRSIGYRGRPIVGLPFDDECGIVPNDRGRVIDDGGPVPGLYVAGWIKRGARGGIGANRHCGVQTAESIIADWAAGRLGPPELSTDDLDALIAAHGGIRVDADGWAKIDDHERSTGRSEGRRRRKLTVMDDLLRAAEVTVTRPFQ